MSGLRRPLWPRTRPEDGLFVGYCRECSSVFIPRGVLAPSTLIVGASRLGKSKLLYGLCAQCVARKDVTILFDAKGDLAADALAFLAKRCVPPERVVYISPYRDDCPSLNVLDTPAGATPEAVVQPVLDTLMRLTREDGSASVWLREWGAAVLTALAYAGGTIMDVLELTDPTDTRFRSAVVARALAAGMDPIIARRFAELDALRPEEAAARLGPIRTRVSLLRASPFLRRFLGSPSSFSIPELIETPGAVMIVDLGAGPAFGAGESRALGQLLLDRVMAALMGRRDQAKHERRPVHVLVDEAERLATPTLGESLDKAGGLGLRATLAVQHLSQLEREDPTIAASVLSNSRVTIAFGTSRHDAEVVADQVFAGRLPLKEVKSYRTALTTIPRNVLRTTKSRSSSESRSTTSGTTRSDSEQRGQGESMASGHWYPDSRSSNTVTGRNTGRTDSDSWSSSSSESTTEQWVSEPIVFRDIAQVNYYTLEEQKERVIGRIVHQGVGEFLLAWRGGEPRWCRGPIITELTVRPEVFSDYLEAVEERIARPATELDAARLARIEALASTAAPTVRPGARPPKPGRGKPPRPTAPGEGPSGQGSLPFDITSLGGPLGSPNPDSYPEDDDDEAP